MFALTALPRGRVYCLCAASAAADPLVTLQQRPLQLHPTALSASPVARTVAAVHMCVWPDGVRPVSRRCKSCLLLLTYVGSTVVPEMGDALDGYGCTLLPGPVVACVGPS